MRKTVGILSLSAIPDDPRVRRQGDLLAADGWDVFAIGLPGHRSPEPAWTNIAIVEDRPAGSSSFEKAMRLIRRALDAALMVAAPSIAFSNHWPMSHNFSELYHAAAGRRADLWLANDWTAVGLAMHLAKKQGVPYGFDSHELAFDEYAQSWKFLVLRRPLVKLIESKGFAGAAFACCVSDGIADRLKAIYGLSSRPMVVRNSPVLELHSFRPTTEIIEVLYHGLVTPGRGLEACIRSVALWRPEFRLTIRGPASSEFKQILDKTVKATGVGDRVTIADPVPMTELIAAATSFDVGLFALPAHSLQNVYVLPNKFFEYTMAGLALCVSDLPEMTKILREYDLGRTISSVKPEAIADTINSLTRESINKFKRNSLAAAKKLNWRVDAQKLLDACNAALLTVDSRPATGSR